MNRLDKCWSRCLRMWKWISEEWAQDSHDSVVQLKGQWLKEHRFKILYNNCFFCAYDTTRNCSRCPATLVDPSFHCFAFSKYSYHDPISFYAKLLELDKIRKES